MTGPLWTFFPICAVSSASVRSSSSQKYYKQKAPTQEPCCYSALLEVFDPDIGMQSKPTRPYSDSAMAERLSETMHTCGCHGWIDRGGSSHSQSHGIRHHLWCSGGGRPVCSVSPNGCVCGFRYIKVTERQHHNDHCHFDWGGSGQGRTECLAGATHRRQRHFGNAGGRHADHCFRFAPWLRRK